MSTDQLSNSLNTPSAEAAPAAALDQAVLKLAAEAAFLQAFAENLADLDVPAEEAAPSRARGEIDFGWRAGLRL